MNSSMFISAVFLLIAVIFFFSLLTSSAKRDRAAKQ